jgi:UDP-N-acetyl-D-galactosamine dehydrogenase
VTLAELPSPEPGPGEVRLAVRAAAVLYTSESAELAQADFHIVAVPTPVDEAHQPDLSPVESASRSVGRALKRGDIVVYESTVYPGVTEEVCVPILEQVSGLRCGPDFTVGYSPERINPGDKEHTFTRIRKVVSGQDARTLEIVAAVYASVVEAGVHKAPTIKVAEAAKVIENTQRDLNIALMNELALIFDRMDIDTLDVLEAAGTKWNFLKFRPGLVGGHCIGVDPYYLTHKAERVGYIPQVILAGRRINDGMGSYIAQQTVKQMVRVGHPVAGSRVTVLGLTFKEDCPDLRNSKVADVIRELSSFGCRVHVHDPIADVREAQHEYGLALESWDALPRADALVVAVAHKQFLSRPTTDYYAKVMERGCFVDVKSRFDMPALQRAGLTVWRL